MTPLGDEVTDSAKIVVAGDFGVGKTTLIGSVSEYPPLSTEETLTTASVGTDSVAGLPGKATTTVGMDFGRVTLQDAGMVLYLFGTPGQRRFWTVWPGLLQGAIGVLVLCDPRRMSYSYEVFDYLEQHTQVPVAVGINQFPGAPELDPGLVRSKLDLLPGTPVVACDARDRASSVRALINLVEFAVQPPRTDGGVA